MFKRWARRYGPQAFVMHGTAGALVAPPTSAPALSLLIGEAETAHQAAREILRRHSYSNATVKAFWLAVMSEEMATPRIFIGGEPYRVSDKQTLQRIYDLFLLYATADARPQTVRAIALEAA